MKQVVNNRASICKWELEFCFRNDEQIRNFFKLLMEKELLFNFDYEQTLDETSELHYVTIKGSWADNLVKVAEILEKVDYNND